MSRRVMNHLRLTIKTENLDEKPYFHRTTFGAPLHLAHNWFCVASPITPPPVYANVLPSIEPVELEASLSPIPHQPAYIDLISPTAEPSSPIMPSSPVRPGVASSGTTKRRHEETSSTPSSASSSRPAKVRRLDYTPKRDASPSTDPGKDAEVIDLIEYVSYDEYREKKLLAADKKRMAADAVRPMRLADFQCIICMDQPTDLTVTHCGMYNANLPFPSASC